MNSRCGRCTNSSYQCQWCYFHGSCVRQGDSCPISNSAKDTGIISSSGCPIVWTSSHDKEILVHSGEQLQIAVQVRNLYPEQSENIKCHFLYLGNNVTVRGDISSQSLTCGMVKVIISQIINLYVYYLTVNWRNFISPFCLTISNSLFHLFQLSLQTCFIYALITQILYY